MSEVLRFLRAGASVNGSQTTEWNRCSSLSANLWVTERELSASHIGVGFNPEIPMVANKLPSFQAIVVRYL